MRAAHAMINALGSNGQEGNGKQEPDELRVQLVVRGTTGPARESR
jgi:hypothetical protein